MATRESDHGKQAARTEIGLQQIVHAYQELNVAEALRKDYELHVVVPQDDDYYATPEEYLVHMKAERQYIERLSEKSMDEARARRELEAAVMHVTRKVLDLPEGRRVTIGVNFEGVRYAVALVVNDYEADIPDSVTVTEIEESNERTD